LITLLMSGSAAAASPKCEPYDSAYEKAPLFKVKAASGNQRVYYYSAPNDCSNLKRCAARKQSYLVPGDEVFGGPEERGFRCAYYYGSAKGILIAGFLPVENLQSVSREDGLSAGFLAGKWEMRPGPHLAPNTITIEGAGPERVKGSGQAYYQSAETVNEGSFGDDDVTVGPGTKEVMFHDGICDVTVRRRGTYLVAEDNGNCGGMNVRFEGIYVRARPE
jgi:hypothetical protein